MKSMRKSPVLVMSADRGATEKIKEKPGISFLRKPVDLMVFLDKVGSLI